MPAPDPETLELLRSASGLSVDDDGRFLHRGEPITHERTLAVLWSSLARREDGRWEIAVGRERAYVAVDETPWAVRALEQPASEGEPPFAVLTDGSRERLDASSLRVGADGVVRCRLARGSARFTRAGQASLAPWLDEDPPGSGRFFVTLGGRRFPIGAGR